METYSPVSAGEDHHTDSGGAESDETTTAFLARHSSNQRKEVRFEPERLQDVGSLENNTVSLFFVYL